MKTWAFLLMIFTFSHIASQNNNSSFSFTYELTEDIANTELSRYSKARDHLKQDSLFCSKSIYFSPYLADLDFFYFKDVVIGDSILNSKLFFKNRWFEDYYSSRLDSTMRKQFVEYDYIAFFSLVEHDMLHADVFPKRIDIAPILSMSAAARTTFVIRAIKYYVNCKRNWIDITRYHNILL